MSEDKLLVGMRANVGQYHAEKLKQFSNKTDLPIARLIAIAIDNELEKEKPFDVDLKIPEVDWEEYTYSDEAGKILSYLKKYGTGIELSLLLVLRYDVGVPDKETFINAFAECIKYDCIEPYLKKTVYSKEERLFYRRKDLLEGAKKNRYNKFLRLQKEFEGMKK